MKIKIKKFKQVNSTNDVAIKLIKRNIQGPTLLHQKNKKKVEDRWGKNGFQKKEIFFFLYFLNLIKKINFKQFAILNAFLIKKVISKKISKKIMIKWPNDLLFNKQKFCGILQEVVKFEHFDYLIVGIGLNTNIAPQNKSFKSTCLKNILNKSISNQKILKDIKSAYEKFLSEKITYLSLI